jgi:hypothetical protein
LMDRLTRHIEPVRTCTIGTDRGSPRALPDTAAPRRPAHFSSIRSVRSSMSMSSRLTATRPTTEARHRHRAAQRLATSLDDSRRPPQAPTASGRGRGPSAHTTIPPASQRSSSSRARRGRSLRRSIPTGRVRHGRARHGRLDAVRTWASRRAKACVRGCVRDHELHGRTPGQPNAPSGVRCALSSSSPSDQVPQENENPGVATRNDQELNQLVSGPFRANPQVTQSARGTLSRWRHAFEPRWDYTEERRSEALSSLKRRLSSPVRPAFVPRP